MVIDSEVLLSSPHLLDLMDIRAHKVSRGGYLLEGIGEVVGPLMVIVGVVLFEKYSPCCSNEIRVLQEGFLVALLERPY